MVHINIKPAERTRVYETPEQAINHIFIFGCHAPSWDYGGAPFGRTMDARRAIGNAIKARNFSAFTAAKRRGYWRVELTGA